MYVVPGLPLDFHQLLSLRELKLDDNSHMVYPPVTVLEKGIDSIRVWCKRRVADRQHSRRHTIVLALHNVLSQIQEVWTILACGSSSNTTKFTNHNPPNKIYVSFRWVNE